jgi:hypothetical protein
MTARLLAMALLAAVAAACGDDTATSPTDTDTTATGTTVTYTGTIDVGGSRFYSFTNSAAGSVTAFLASVTAPDTRLPVPAPLEVGVGTPAGTDCATTTTQVVSPSLVSQMSVSLAAGVFCLRVADAGELTAPVTFAVRFTHP